MPPKLAALLFLPAAFAPAADAPKPAAVIPFRLNESKQYFIQARINGSEPVTCGVDSGGGDRLYLDRDRAARMGIEATGAGYSANPNAAQMTRDSRARVDLETGGLKFPNQTVLLQSRPNPGFSCNIGQTVFRPYIVEVDYQAAELRLYNSESFRYQGSGHRLPITLEQGNPFVAASIMIPGGKTLAARVAVDTGCGYGLVLFSKSYADRTGLLSQAADPTPDRRWGMMGQQPRVVAARVDKFSVGPVEIPRAIILVQQFQGFGGANGPDGLLCGDFLGRFRLIFDYNAKQLILEPNPPQRD